MRTAVYKDVVYPAIGRPVEPRPEVPPAVYAARLERVRRAMAARGLDALAVYGDREHFANLQWLTHYDPRFEEALLVVLPHGTPHLLVGNEGMAYARIARLDVHRVLYQPFSLLGQPRGATRPLHQLLREAGLAPGARVGVAGWKYFAEGDGPAGAAALDVPEFVASAIRHAAAGADASGTVTNETALFMAAQDGLRNTHEPEQLADFEWIATHNSQNLLDGIRAVAPGLREHELFAHMPYYGLALGCSPICASGENVHLFLGSPTSRVIEKGDPIFMTQAYQGSNCCRFGWVARDAGDMPAAARDYVEHLAIPYFEAQAAWYEALHVGATGDALHHAVADRLEPLGCTLALNCGHLIAADEWTHSSVYAGSRETLQNGSYWQCDFFPTVPTAHFGAFTEDGLALADAALRAELAERYPALWQRVTQRRDFMQHELGINLHDDVLPFSNFPAAVIPFFLSPDRCIARQCD